MPRIFWSIKRKKALLSQSKTMTVNELAKKHFQPVAEIERMLRQLSPNNPLIKDIRMEHGIKVTFYYPGWAEGIQNQRIGARNAVY